MLTVDLGNPPPGAVYVCNGDRLLFVLKTDSTDSVEWQVEPPTPNVEIDKYGIFAIKGTLTRQQGVLVVAKGGGGKQLATFPLMLSPEIVVTPNAADVGPGQSVLFRVSPPDQSVLWSIANLQAVPSSAQFEFGTLDPATGAYTAPNEPIRRREIVITATRCGAPGAIAPTATARLNGSASVNLTNVAFCKLALKIYWVVLSCLMAYGIKFFWSEVCDQAKSSDLTVAPPIVTVKTNGTLQFEAKMEGIAGAAGPMYWDATQGSIVPTNGLFTPTNLKGGDRVTVRATSVSNPKKFAAATLIVSDSDLAVLPPSAAARAGQIVPFKVSSARDNVQWEVTPVGAGSISTNGVYTAPEGTSGLRQATVLARLSDSPGIQAAALVSLAPPDSTCSTSFATISLVFIMGALGSVLHAVASFVIYLGNQKFRVSWAPWYYFQPLTGGGMAVAVFFLLGAGLLTGLSTAGLTGVLASAALVGMFAEHASLKLKELVEALLPLRTDERKDKANPTQAR